MCGNRIIFVLIVSEGTVTSVDSIKPANNPESMDILSLLNDLFCKYTEKIL
jgi:hypothetical protein